MLEKEERLLPAFDPDVWRGVWRWGQWNLEDPWCLPDFHEVWPTEVETERQDRGKRQTELGRRRDGVPSADSRVHFHQGTGSALLCVVFAAATAKTSVMETCPWDLWPAAPPPPRPLSVLQAHPQTHPCVRAWCKCERASGNTHLPASDMILQCLPGQEKQKRRAVSSSTVL